MKNAALAIAGCVASVIGFIERCCWLNSPGIAMLAVLVAFLISFDSYPNVAVLLAPCSRIFLIMSHGRVVLRTAVAPLSQRGDRHCAEKHDRITSVDNGFLDTVLANFTNAISGNWGPLLQVIMAKVLLAVIVLQFGLIAVDCIANHDIAQLLMNLMLGIIRIGVVYAVFINLFDWGNDVVQTDVYIGYNIPTLSPLSLTPSGGSTPV